MSYILTTDSTCDFPIEFYSENHIPCVHVDYMVNDVVYDGETASMPILEFYDAIRKGAMPKTQQVNPQASREFFKTYLEKGLDVLHIAFSSGLSGTYSSNTFAAEELREEYPDRKIIVVDSLSASAGEGLLVYEAVKRCKAGMDIDTLAKWIEDHKLYITHDVVADDLFHLYRGGRVSKGSAIMGTTLGIKPLIYLDSEGKLKPYSKVRGKKQGLQKMADRMAKEITDDKEFNTVYISHSDCPEDAELLKSMIVKNCGKKYNIVTTYIGPTIGSHTGVGTVALFYFAKETGRATF